MPDQPARPDPALWDEPTMHRALAARDVTSVYQALVKLGFTQSQIAALTGQSQSEVSEILQGRRVISYQVLKRIADGLGIPRGHMGLAYADAEGHVVPYPEQEGEGNPDPLEDDDVITRRVLGAVTVALFGEAALDRPIMQLGTHLLGEFGDIPRLTGSSGKLEKYHIGWIRTATDRFRELDHELGGGAIHAAVRGLAERVVGALLDSSPSRELYVVVSGLCRVAAWTAFDSGRKREFWQCYATALHLAREAGDTTAIVTIVRDAGRAHILSGRPRDAAKLFELTAVRRTPDAVGWGLLACAYASNSPDAARRALVRLRDAPGADTPDATSMIGHVSLGLGEYSAAVAAYEEVLPQRSGRVAVQETAPMAVAHLKAGEAAIGLRYAEQAIDLNDKVRSKAATAALSDMVPLLTAQKDSTAQDLTRRIAYGRAIA